MAETTVSPKAAKPKTASKKTASKKPAAKKQDVKISDMDVIRNMTFNDLIENVNANKIDFDKAVDYKAMPWINKQNKPSKMYIVEANGKDVAIAQTPAVALAKEAESDPAALVLKLLAYYRGNPHAE